jgi:HD-like signal output (HDOD) protein/ActR/RegA family two-component response regulator
MDTPSGKRKRILFVDDESAVLAGLQNLLYKDRKRWDLVFALGGEAALREVRSAPFDVVISDMRMPGMDGAEVLQAVKDESPATVRIMLSGYADGDAVKRALPVLHQFLTKPCDIKTLRGAIERCLDHLDVERDIKLRGLVEGIERLPTPPDIYFELTRRLQSPTTSIASVADVVARDPALTAKLLQLVNSAYFSNGSKTMSIRQAVSQLGIDRLRSLALTAVFSESTGLEEGRGLSLKDMQRDALRVANAARDLATPAEQDDAFAAALLHDIGYLVLARHPAVDFAQFCTRVQRGESPLDVERQLFGVTHADVGARLLAVWGVPTATIDAVQFHHDPGSAPEVYRRLASIVHVADAVTTHSPVSVPLNRESLEAAGFAKLYTK